MHVSVPIVLVVIGTLVVAAAVFFLARQLVVSRASGSVECSFERRTRRGRRAWQMGLLRYGSDRLRWFRAFTWSFGPDAVIRRTDIVDLERQLQPGAVPDMEEQVLVQLHLRAGDVQRIMLPRSSSSALLAWYEAAPAGWLSVGGD